MLISFPSAVSLVQLPVPLVCSPPHSPPAAALGWLCRQFWLGIYPDGLHNRSSVRALGEKKRKNSLVVKVLAQNVDFDALCQTCFVIQLGSPLGAGCHKVFCLLITFWNQWEIVYLNIHMSFILYIFVYSLLRREHDFLTSQECGGAKGEQLRETSTLDVRVRHSVITSSLFPNHISFST